MYYRLKQTDFDGKFEYYGPVSITICSDGELQLIMQNIFDGQLSGSVISKENTELKIEIVDMEARIIRNEKLNVLKGANSLQLDLNGMNKGVYIIKLSNEKNLVIARFVKL